MGVEKPADIESCLRPSQPDDLPEPGYEEWLAEEIAAGNSEMDVGEKQKVGEEGEEEGALEEPGRRLRARHGARAPGHVGPSGARQAARATGPAAARSMPRFPARPKALMP